MAQRGRSLDQLCTSTGRRGRWRCGSAGACALLVAMIAPASLASPRRIKAAPAQRHFDVAGSRWSGRVDAGEFLQGDAWLRVDGVGRVVRGGVAARDSRGLLSCALHGQVTDRTDATARGSVTCRGEQLRGEGALTLRRRDAVLEIRLLVRGRPMEGEIPLTRAGPARR